MSFTVIPNSGIMFSDRLDELRVGAVMEHFAKPLPEAVVNYIRALEGDYLNRRHQDHMRSAEEVGFQPPYGESSSKEP